jgi:single-strand DNA-binding protein
MNINHLIVSGNLTRDPELRTVGADKSVCSFTIANSTKFKGGDGEMKEETAFIDCDAWGRQGEIAAQYYQKGSAAIVEGSIRQDNWTDKDGQKRSKLKLRVDRVHLLPRREQPGDGDPPIGREEAHRPAPARPVVRATGEKDTIPF